MIEIKATTNVQALSRGIRELGARQLPFAMALAATRTAQAVQSTLLDEMAKVFDRPTPTTLRSLYLKRATKTNLVARVWFKDAFTSGIPADRYLQPEVFGGARRPKRMETALRARGLLAADEWAIPTRDAQNQFGNLPGALANRILSGLGAAETVSGYQANATSSRRSKKKGNAKRFFVAKIGKANGVWERKAFGHGAGIRPLILFVRRPPVYRQRLDFFGIAEKVVADRYMGEFSAAIDQAIATAKK